MLSLMALTNLRLFNSQKVLRHLARVGCEALHINSNFSSNFNMEPPSKKAKVTQKQNSSSPGSSKKKDNESSKPSASKLPLEEEAKVTMVTEKSDLADPFPTSVGELKQLITSSRLKAGKSIINFKFERTRVRTVEVEKIPEDAEGVVYWMSRDQRVQDNWAFLFAQKLALKNEVPLHVCFCLVSKFLDATYRHYDFLLKGLKEVEKECRALDINFHLLMGPAVEKIPDFVTKMKIGAVVTDFSPLRVPMGWVKSVKKALPKEIPFCQVDAHNIVPCWEASPKQEYGARTIRNKINSKLSTYLTEFPPVIKHPHKSSKSSKPVNWEAAYGSLEVDDDVGPVDWATPGYMGALTTLHSFLQKRLRTFSTDRNDPTKDSLSNLSPWFHFGQISVQRAILAVQPYKKKWSESVASFCEEAIIRRELSDNFCFYNDKYDQVAGTNAWSIKTLDDHRKDKREYLYSLDEFDRSMTHDDLWNAAQLQLVKQGKMHGFMRMYWAKKILEWTETPEIALKTALYLNDRYNLDGRDPNGYVGCMWSICGIHDQGWGERPVFGKIRYMVYHGCKRKFDVSLYVKQWGARVHHKPKNYNPPPKNKKK